MANILLPSVLKGRERSSCIYEVGRDLTLFDWGKAERRGTYMTCSNHSMCVVVLYI